MSESSLISLSEYLCSILNSVCARCVEGFCRIHGLLCTVSLSSWRGWPTTLLSPRQRVFVCMSACMCVCNAFSIRVRGHWFSLQTVGNSLLLCAQFSQEKHQTPFVQQLGEEMNVWNNSDMCDASTCQRELQWLVENSSSIIDHFSLFKWQIFAGSSFSNVRIWYDN